MSWGTCQSKGCAVRIPPGLDYCFDCVYPTPQQRQQHVAQVDEALACARETLRDKFATGALVVAYQKIKDDDPTEDTNTDLIAALAYDIAEAMIRQRKDDPFDSEEEKEEPDAQ